MKLAQAKRRRGLSLLEVILSLAILVMSLTAIGALINMGSDHEFQTRLYNTGSRLAQSKLAEIEAGFVPLEATRPEAFENEPGWSWFIKDAEDKGANLWLVTVTVSRVYRGVPFELSIGQMMLDPAVRGSASKLSRPTPVTDETIPPEGSP